MKKLNILLPLILCIFYSSCSTSNKTNLRNIASEESGYIYFSTKVYEGSGSTDFMRSSGIAGALFGHVSQAHYKTLADKTSMKALKDIVADKVDYRDVKFMPISTDRFQLSGTEEKIVNGKAYKKFNIDFKLSFNFFVKTKNPIYKSNYKAVVADELYVVVSDKNGDISKVKITPEQLLKINAIDTSKDSFEDVTVNAETLKLTKKQKLTLNQEIVRYLEEENITDLEKHELKFKIESTLDNATSITMTLEKSSESDVFLRTLYLKGFLPKFRKNCAGIISFFMN